MPTTTTNDGTEAGPDVQYIPCACGLADPHDVGSPLWVQSPRTRMYVEVPIERLDQLPPRVRGRIVTAEGQANFSPNELAAIAKLGFTSLEKPFICSRVEDLKPLPAPPPHAFFSRKKRCGRL